MLRNQVCVFDHDYSVTTNKVVILYDNLNEACKRLNIHLTKLPWAHESDEGWKKMGETERELSAVKEIINFSIGIVHVSDKAWSIICEKAEKGHIYLRVGNFRLDSNVHQINIINKNCFHVINKIVDLFVKDWVAILTFVSENDSISIKDLPGGVKKYFIFDNKLFLRSFCILCQGYLLVNSSLIKHPSDDVKKALALMKAENIDLSQDGIDFQKLAALTHSRNWWRDPFRLDAGQVLSKIIEGLQNARSPSLDKLLQEIYGSNEGLLEPDKKIMEKTLIDIFSDAYIDAVNYLTGKLNN